MMDAGMASLGTGGRLSGSCNAFNVWRFPGAMGSPSKACLAADSSPIWTRSKALSARFSTESPCCVRRLREDAFDASASHCWLTWIRSSQRPCENKLNLSFNLPLGIKPPRAGLWRSILGKSKKSFQDRVTRNSSLAACPKSASVNATLIAERYAPRKNFGDFITEALNLNRLTRSTRSKQANPARVARLTITSSQAAAATSPAASSASLSPTTLSPELSSTSLSSPPISTLATPSRERSGSVAVSDKASESGSAMLITGTAASGPLTSGDVGSWCAWPPTNTKRRTARELAGTVDTTLASKSSSNASTMVDGTDCNLNRGRTFLTGMFTCDRGLSTHVGNVPETGFVGGSTVNRGSSSEEDH